DVWTCGLITDRTVSGGALKWLTLVDEYPRECLAWHVGRLVSGADVRRVLARPQSRIKVVSGVCTSTQVVSPPKVERRGNGRESASRRRASRRRRGPGRSPARRPPSASRQSAATRRAVTSCGASGAGLEPVVPQ